MPTAPSFGSREQSTAERVDPVPPDNPAAIATEETQGLAASALPAPGPSVDSVLPAGTTPKFEFCLPTLGKAVPAGPEWFHEIKYDGYRLLLEPAGTHVRLITKGGYERTGRYPRIVEAALKNRQKILFDMKAAAN